MKKILGSIIMGILLVTCAICLVSCGGKSSKVEKIDFYYDKEMVKSLLGEPFEETDLGLVYYGDNALKIMKKGQKLQEEYANAVINLDFEKMISLEEEIDKLQEKMANMQFEYVQVVFTEKGYVEEVIYDKNMGGETNELKSTAENLAEITVSDFTENSLEISIKYPDGSYKLKKLKDISFINRGAVCGVDKTDVFAFEYSDSWGEYSNIHYGDEITKLYIPENTIDFTCIKNGSIREIWYEGTLEDWCNSVEDYDFYVSDIYFNGKKLQGDIVLEEGVAAIPNFTFADSDITSIVIPNSVEYIGDSAFSGCNSLKSVIFEENSKLKTIEYDAFGECRSLTTVIIPDSVTSIGGIAFIDCTSLTSIEIPNSVTSIGGGAFVGCQSMSEIRIPTSVKKIGNGIFDGQSKGVIVYCEAKSKPTGWDENAFNNRLIVWDCNNNDVADDGNVYVISDGITYKLKGDEAVVTIQPTIDVAVISPYITYKDKTYPVTNIEEAAFDELFSANRLQKVTIPSSVTSIGDYAFSDCSLLETVVIGDSVTSIGDGAFYNCESLTIIEIPDSVTSIGDYAFSDCNLLENVVIGDSVESIGVYAFESCSSLTSVVIPGSVKNIGNGAFSNSSSLSKVNYTGTVDAWAMIKFDDRWANPICESENLYINDVLVTEVNLTTATKINDYAFYDCGSLTSVVIGDSVTSIGDYAFSACGSLTSVVIGDGATSIGDYAFSHTSLARVVIPICVESMGGHVFFSWSSGGHIRIYCISESKPDGWSSNWNRAGNSSLSVVWGYTGE